MSTVPQYPDADDDPIGTRCRRSNEAHDALERNPREGLAELLADLAASTEHTTLLETLAVAERTLNAVHDALDRLEGVVR